MTGDERFQVQRERIRTRFLKYTRKAFRMLPRMDKPRILDIGCGSGIPTIELAKLSEGEVTGIDIDQLDIDEFSRKIADAGFTDRVQAVCCSMFDMDFADETFDIIWTEGAIYPVGFEKGLREWRRLLKQGRFLVVHDEQGNVEEKLGQMPDCGYELLGHFLLSEDIWWNEYFVPLEKLVNETQLRYPNDPKIREAVHGSLAELDMFRRNPQQNKSVYFVMKKN